MATEQIIPVSILASSNYAAPLASSIDDDPDSPDGLWLIGIDSGTDTDVRVEMSNPVNPLTSAAVQTVKVQVRKFSSGGGTPDCVVELWENGSFVQTIISATAVSSTTGVVLTGTFFSSAVTNRDNVEIRVIGERSGGNPSSRRSVEVGAIRWAAETTAPQPPGTPGNLSAVDATTGGTVDLSWTAPIVGGTPTDYIVEYRTPINSGPYTVFPDGVSTATTASVTGLSDGTPYRFRVKAENAAGQSGYAASAVATPTGPRSTGVKVATGSLWVDAGVKVANGSAWVDAAASIADGTVWG